ncbi:MAG: hypothetical protein JWM17_2370 [Actinobacteria bacterium]|jgi:hypothetical protein|nr:hypothetical protein [Actinomycetota bacterium]
MSVILEVVIGLSFVFIVLSLVASGANELVAAALRLRAGTLKQGIVHVLGNPSDAEDLYRHPLVQSLYLGRKGPSYLPSEKFAIALLDSKVRPAVSVAASGAAAGTAAVATAIKDLPDGQVKAVLDVLWREAGEDIAGFQRAVAHWFDDSMDRVSGWYRRRAQAMLLAFGLILAVGLNVNAVTMTQRLWTDAPLRDAVAQQAQRALPPPSSDRQAVASALGNVASGLATISGLSLPIGWGNGVRPGTWYVALVGWLLTAIAVSLGAPFWFDLLGRVAQLRVTGAVPDASPSAPAAPAGASALPGATTG